MADPFTTDEFPGKGRILFVGDIHGSHARSWIEIARQVGFNVQCFALANGTIPPDFKVPTYSPLPHTSALQMVIGRRSQTGLIASMHCCVFWDEMDGQKRFKRALAKAILRWKPDIVHTLGLFPASQFYLSTLPLINEFQPFWVAQARGGPDMEISRHFPDQLQSLKQIFNACDGFVADTDQNLELAVNLGLSPEKQSSIGRVPGTRWNRSSSSFKICIGAPIENASGSC